MRLAPVNWIDVDDVNALNAPGGIYVHAREVAVWLRDNDLGEAAGDLEAFAAEAEGARTQDATKLPDSGSAS